MAKSALTIHKEIQKKLYAESPLGQTEKKIAAIYDSLKKNKQVLPEEVAKQVYDIRDKHEKDQMAYIDMSQKRDREEGDRMLLEAMTKELELLNNHLSTTENKG